MKPSYTPEEILFQHKLGSEVIIQLSAHSVPVENEMNKSLINETVVEDVYGKIISFEKSDEDNESMKIQIGDIKFLCEVTGEEILDCFEIYFPKGMSTVDMPLAYVVSGDKKIPIIS